MKLNAASLVNHDALFRLVPWLVIVCLALFPVGRSAEFPLAVLALIGLKVLYENIKANHWEKPILVFTLFFLCLWLPILFSLPDSYKLSKSSSLAIVYLRFYLSGLAVLKYAIHSRSVTIISRYSLIIVSFWIFDGLVQFFLGTDLFGYKAIPQRLNGIFGQKYKLGLFLAVYSPFVFSLLYEKKYFLLKLLLNALCLVVMLLAGSRGGWIMYAVVLFFFVGYKWRNNLKMFAVSLGILLLSSVVVGTALYHSSDGFADRMDTTLEVFKGDEKSVDQAISLRLPIWKTAISMIQAHPMNGVGARAFRYAYLDHAKNDDIYLKMNSAEGDQAIGAYHPHQMQLEVLSETGLIGGMFFLGAMAILLWYWRSRNEMQKHRMLPFALGVTALFFPLNTHYATYSSAWAQVIYWFATLYFAAGAIDDPLPAPSAATASAAT